jgi:non-canonical poly(A) RNA polymerase PAPD5/7
MKWNNANIKPFGSFMSGLYLPTADMDVVICSSQFMNGSAPMFSTKSHLFKTRDHLVRHGIPHGGDVEVISGAKVPLVKYIDETTGLRVDISFENLTGTEAIDTFLEWKDQYPAMPKLVAIIKHYLCMRGLNEPANGGIGGFSVICMVVNLLNNWPAIQSGTMNPEHHLGETLMEFFRMYGYEFDYETTAISMNPPRFVPKVCSISAMTRSQHTDTTLALGDKHSLQKHGATLHH